MAHKILDDCTGCGICKNSCPVLAITGEAGQVHEINPTRCIDCSVCGMSCPQGCIIDSNGGLIQKTTPGQRLKPFINHSLCRQCMLCVDLCRFGALYIHLPLPPGIPPDEILFDINKCVGCGFCELKCPANAISMKHLP